MIPQNNELFKNILFTLPNQLLVISLKKLEQNTTFSNTSNIPTEFKKSVLDCM